jgi:cytochrome c peroxidase
MLMKRISIACNVAVLALLGSASVFAATAPASTPLATPAALSSAELASIAEYLALDTGNLFNYAAPSLPTYYAKPPVGPADNTPPDNRITNPAATLGRVLFNDKRLSINSTISCASCHQQASGFTDPKKFSAGAVPPAIGTAHAMRLGNLSFYRPGTMFWNKRAASAEAQSTQPIQATNEMGFDATHGGMNAVVAKMQKLPYYPALFKWVYGTAQVTEPRMQKALAQYERAMISAGSRWDTGFAKVYNPALPDKGFSLDVPGLTVQENAGRRLFILNGQSGGVGCAGCHAPPTFALNANALSNGLDAGASTVFKAPSLKNVGLGKAFMHDGRFATLEQVVDHYDHGVKDSPSLDNRLKTPEGLPRQLHLSVADKAALVAFMKTLTDTAFVRDARFSDPFKK